MNLSSLLSQALLALISKLKFSIEVSITCISSINSSFWKGSISISSLVFSLHLIVPLEIMSKTTTSNAKFQLPTIRIKKLQVISFKSKGFSNLFRYVFYLQIIKLISRKVEVKRKVKGQEEKHLQKLQKFIFKPNAKNNAN
jgi:hypothetical protein